MRSYAGLLAGPVETAHELCQATAAAEVGTGPAARYQLAAGGQSCAAACASHGQRCDLDGLLLIANDVQVQLQHSTSSLTRPSDSISCAQAAC